LKILVLSDTHNVVLDSQIKEIKKQGKFDLLIHCGDNYKDGDRFAQVLGIDKVLKVPGNCDYNFANENPIIIKEIQGKKFIITHGHLHNVKSGIEKLKEYAKKSKAEVVLYGHTHAVQNERIEGILFFNPGSAIFPRGDQASFGVIDITLEKVDSKILPL